MIFCDTGDGQDFLNLALKEGGIILTMSLGNGQLEMDIRPNRIRFDDNQWHKLTVHRKVQEVNILTACICKKNPECIFFVLFTRFPQ